ncbi:hypothetical protein, partial [Methylacidimicrobium cyclopophantes]|uniref:hypothetical protein n=1 Tax=Methylacidimicrobium cyclopophantes TaxID=1041766 RepID=UPI001C49C7E0
MATRIRFPGGPGSSFGRSCSFLPAGAGFLSLLLSIGLLSATFAATDSSDSSEGAANSSQSGQIQ